VAGPSSTLPARASSIPLSTKATNPVGDA
jgi:hypothetical protein